MAGMLVLAGILYLGLTPDSVANRDYIEYWAAGQQLSHGGNPYDTAAIYRLQKPAGLEGMKPKVSFSPPVALVLMAPLGWVSAKTGLILWSIALLSSTALSLWIVWMLNGRPDSRLHLLGFLFAPLVVCQMAGQIGDFLLLGVAIFLLLHRSRPFLAGAALLPCAWKPHLFLPMAIVLVLWVLLHRAYWILAGFLVTLLATSTLTVAMDHQVWTQYARMMGTTGVLTAFVPTLSSVLKFLIDVHASWLQYVPEGLACVWGCWYFWTRRERWQWTEQGMLLLLISVMCTPYAWVTDEAVLLPAVLAGLYRVTRAGRSPLLLWVLCGVALVEALAVVRIDSIYYLWTTPAWLGWYLYATRSKIGEAEPATV